MKLNYDNIEDSSSNITDHKLMNNIGATYNTNTINYSSTQFNDNTNCYDSNGNSRMTGNKNNTIHNEDDQILKLSSDGNYLSNCDFSKNPEMKCFDFGNIQSTNLINANNFYKENTEDLQANN